jgi:protein gp37
VSPGCKHCYAEALALRLQAMGQSKYHNGFLLTLQPDMLESPLTWKKSQIIFVNSMSDLFHEKIPESYVHRVFGVMRRAWWHQFQVLTKRAERLEELSNDIEWPRNVWMGVSVENQDYIYRIDHLRHTSAHIKFLSLEPLLGPLSSLDLRGIDWVIVGGESGPGSRPIHKQWVVEIRNQCVEAGVAFFFKQWGGVNKKRTGRLLDGRTWDDLPRKFVVEESLFSALGSVGQADATPNQRLERTGGEVTRHSRASVATGRSAARRVCPV